MKFESIEHFKAASEFFPSNKIIPQRILKGPRRLKHHFTFGSDSWVFPTPEGYLIACDTIGSKSGAAITLSFPSKNKAFYDFSKSNEEKKQANRYKNIEKNHHFRGSPYVPGGSSFWYGNSNEKFNWIDTINKHFEGTPP